MHNEPAARKWFDLLVACVPLGYLLLVLGTLADIYAVDGVTASASALTYWLCLALSFGVMGCSWILSFRVLRSTKGDRRLINRAVVGFAVTNGLLSLGFVSYQRDLDLVDGPHWWVPYSGWAVGYLLVAIGFSTFVIGQRRPSIPALGGDDRAQKPFAAGRGKTSRGLILAGFGVVVLGTAIMGYNLVAGPWLHFPRGVAVYFVTSTLAMCVTGWAWWTYSRAVWADPVLRGRLRRPVRIYALSTLVLAIAYLIPPAAPGTLFIGVGYLAATIGLWTGWPKVKEAEFDVLQEAL